MIAKNLPELFANQAEKNKNKIAFEYRLRRNQPYKNISWGRLSEIVMEVSYGLVELGVKKADKVALLSSTRYEWAICDLAILTLGGIVVPIYPTLPEDSVTYILNNSECEIVILEDKGQLQKIRSRWDKLSRIRYAIVIEDLGDLPEHDRRIISLKTLKDKGKLNLSKDPYLIEKHVNDINPCDVATIIYTSGTTGLPKGVVLSHKNILSVLEVLPEKLPLCSSDKFLSFLPLSHVFERVAGLYYAISAAVPVCYCSNIDQIGSALNDSMATLMLVVPRLLEKMFNRIHSQIDLLNPAKRNVFRWAYNTGSKKLRYKNQKKILSPAYWFSSIEYFFADKLIFSALRKKIAPKLRCFISGGAPLSEEISEFFWIIGIPVLEGYGLTETSAPACVNNLKENKIGTVGKPLSNVEIKIANDGEILIKGPNVFSSYYKDEASTKDVFCNGYFQSGDIGLIDKDGFLKITDRKKDIIKNSGGKIIAPQKIENALKGSPYISNVVVIGDKRKYLSALVTLEKLQITEFARQNNISSEDIGVLCNHPKIIKLIEDQIKLKTTLFADYEQIVRFTILPDDFSVTSGEITPTLKVKRKFVEEKYKILIKAMYPLLFFLFFLFSFFSSVSALENYGYENDLTCEVSIEEFSDLLLGAINETRSLNGVLPLKLDQLAQRVSEDQAGELIMLGYLSYYNSKKQSPDERYTLLGGTGAITEIVKGFESNNKKIVLNKLLANQFVQAMRVNQDDLNVLLNPYVNFSGCGILLSKDKRRFVSVVEFLTKGGDFEPLKLSLNAGEKLFVSGEIYLPFKFRAVSIAYSNMPFETSSESKDIKPSFSNENLIPYFPPQDFIAFTDKAKSNFLNILKGIGIISAIGASPFTGGASALLAPPLISSIQNGPPREIPLKSGIHVRNDGSKFYGEIDLNYLGMAGLYFISVLAELPNVNYPLVISRRTVRVNPVKISKVQEYTPAISCVSSVRKLKEDDKL